MNFSVFLGLSFVSTRFVNGGWMTFLHAKKGFQLCIKKDILKIKWTNTVFVGMKLGSILHGVLGIIPGSV